MSHNQPLSTLEMQNWDLLDTLTVYRYNCSVEHLVESITSMILKFFLNQPFHHISQFLGHTDIQRWKTK